MTRRGLCSAPTKERESLKRLPYRVAQNENTLFCGYVCVRIMAVKTEIWPDPSVPHLCFDGDSMEQDRNLAKCFGFTPLFR
jgi:hypothetical protein